MKKLVLLSTIFLLSTTKTFAQEPWTHVGTIDGSNIVARSVTTDIWGNTYACGEYYNDAYFGDTTLLGNDLLYIAKYDLNNDLVWAKTFGAISATGCQDIRCDALGNIFIATYGDIEVSPGNYLNNPGIFKLDPYGNILWVHEIQAATGGGLNIELDEFGDVYVGFSFSGTNLFAGLILNDVGSGTDAAVGKINSNGIALWVQGYDCSVTFGVGTYDMYYHTDYGILISGKFVGGTIAKRINPANGALLENYQISSSVQDVQPNGVLIDNDGNVIIGGLFAQGIDFGTTSLTPYEVYDSFLASYDLSGNFQWVNHVYPAAGNYTEIQDLACDENNNYFLLGEFTAPSMVIGLDTLYTTNEGSFAAKCDEQGNFLWSSSFGSCGGTFYDMAAKIMYQQPHQILATGMFTYDSYFGDVYVPYAGTSDRVYILKGVDEGNVISGHYYLDINNNGLQETTEPDLVNKMIIADTNQSYTFTNNSGDFITQIDTGSFLVKPNSIPAYHNLYPSNYALNYSSFYNYDSLLDFRLVPIPNVSDLVVDLTPYNGLNPGFESAYQLKFKNIGTDTITGSTYLKFNPFLTILSSEITPSFQDSDSLSWNFVDLEPLEEVTINLNFYVSLSSTLGDSMTFVSVALPIVGDTIPENNVHILKREITGSYDPNNKTSNQDSLVAIASIVSQNYFDYVIQFQNTGNDTALTVVIVDTLSNEHDITSLEILGSSHAFNFHLMPQNRMVFTFNAIMLPDMNTNLFGSMGFVKFRVKPKSTLNIGDVIDNTAYIYFDFNPPIITNTTYSEIVDQIFHVSISSENEEVFGTISLFPNPTSNSLNILFGKYLDEVKISVMDNLGRPLEFHYFNDVSGQITIQSDYPPGIYYLLVEDSDGNFVTLNFIKI